MNPTGEQTRQPIDVEWFSESPVTGTIAEQGTAAIALGFDADSGARLQSQTTC